MPTQVPSPLPAQCQLGSKGGSKSVNDVDVRRRRRDELMWSEQIRKRQSIPYRVLAAKPCEEMARRMEENYPDRFTFFPTQWDKFADGTDHIRIGGFGERNLISGQHVLFLASFHDNDATLSQFQVFISLIQNNFVESLTVCLPFYPVGTMERVTVEGTVATAATYAHMFSSLPGSTGRPTRIMIYDLHTLQNRFYLHGNAVASLQSAIPLLRRCLWGERTNNNDINEKEGINCIAFPDDGAAKRFGGMFDDLFIHGICTKVVCGKTRLGEHRSVTVHDGDPQGRNVLIVDDLVQTGGTLYECAVVVKTAGARSVRAFCTHAVFPRQSWKRFLPGGDRHGPLDRFYVTNSIPTVTDHLPCTNHSSSFFQVLDLMPSIVQDLDEYFS